MRIAIVREPGGPEAIEIVERPEPEPNRGEVLVRASAIGVGWPDILLRQGTYKWMPPLPATPGSEMVGRIERLGDDVSGFAVGQSVYLNARDLPLRGGCYAEMIAVPAPVLRQLPFGIDPEQALCIGNLQVAWGMLNDAVRLERVRSVLIRGAAGGVGSAAVQLARYYGLFVIAVVGSEQKADFALNHGADRALNYRTDDIVKSVLDLSGGRGVDLILDHVAGKDFTDNLTMLARFGTVVSFNAQAGPPAKELFQEMRRHAGRSPAVRSFSMHSYDEDLSARQKMTDEAMRLLAEKHVVPAIGARFPFDLAAQAQAFIESGQAVGKVILRPDLVATEINDVGSST
jgi:NADPH2:quinone reductase